MAPRPLLLKNLPVQGKTGLVLHCEIMEGSDKSYTFSAYSTILCYSIIENLHLGTLTINGLVVSKSPWLYFVSA